MKGTDGKAARPGSKSPLAQVVKAQPVKRPKKDAGAAAVAAAKAKKGAAEKKAAAAPAMNGKSSKGGLDETRVEGMVDAVAEEAQRIDETGAPAHRAASKYYRGAAQPLSEVNTPNDDHTSSRFLEVMLPKDMASHASLSLNHRRETLPVLSKFERALVLGHRARELALGARSLAPTDEWKPTKIAEMELQLGLLDDYCISRSLHNSDGRPQSEHWILGDFNIF